jgi:hypothetical protein
MFSKVPSESKTSTLTLTFLWYSIHHDHKKAWMDRLSLLMSFFRKKVYDYLKNQVTLKGKVGEEEYLRSNTSLFFSCRWLARREYIYAYKEYNT